MGRFASCRYKDATSACHAVRAGVPQGSVFSPPLFNFVVSQQHQNCQQYSAYADDFGAAESSTNVRVAASALTDHAELGNFAVGKFAVGKFAVGNLAARKLCRKEISP